MKATLRRLVLAVLRAMAQRQLGRIQPRVVGITGSAGKTTTKDAVAAVLERRFRVKKNSGSMNSEFGTVLTILEEKTGYSSAGKWAGILWRGLWKSLRAPELYDMLVMEMGIDYPGGMDEILTVVKPDVMIFLNVKNVHRGEGQFASRQAIFEEKSKACAAVPAEGWVILNADDNFAKRLHGHLPANTLTIGLDESADLRASEVHAGPKGLQFIVHHEDGEQAVHLPHVLGECHVYMALAAIAVGLLHGMPWKAIALALKEFELPPGRMNRLEGKRGSILIDSSYNASPDTMEEGLKVLQLFGGRKIAALGTMNELGELSDSAHLKLGKMVPDYAEILVAVGPQAEAIAQGAERAGLSRSCIHVFRSSKEAGEFLSRLLERNDVVLAKGSQNKVRMEHLVKACLRYPEQARSTLVRQEPYWMTHL